MTAVLEMLEYHNADHMADVERVCSRVDTHVCRSRAFHKLLLCTRHNILDHTSPSEFFYKILHICISFIFYSFCHLIANYKDTQKNPPYLSAGG